LASGHHTLHEIFLSRIGWCKIHAGEFFMQIMQIEGGRRLLGQMTVQGAKNSVLPILAATLVCPGICVLHNCPRLRDVDASIRILRHLGARVTREGETLVIDPGGVDRCDIPDDLMQEMRSSVIFLGAILARTGCAALYPPGGCELGARPIDLHLKALAALGVEVQTAGEKILCRCHQLQGGTVNLTFPSVGATENIMLAALACPEPVTVTNAAREPEILDLARFLRDMGAEITGAGTASITISGGPAHSVEHRVIGDRIAASTWLAAVASAGGEIFLDGVEPHHLGTVLEVLAEAGCRLELLPGGVHLQRLEPLRAVRPIRTAPYPGFPTDAQPPVMAALVRAAGTTAFVENIFDSRYRHVCELQRMGADIQVEGRVAMVTGVGYLHGANVRGADLRGTAALVVAALGADGVSTVSGLEHLDRGYESAEETLKNLGAAVKRVEIS
jgi:UDP-N-acetylglucosamine 1-carboxyvinyltransferase